MAQSGRFFHGQTLGNSGSRRSVIRVALLASPYIVLLVLSREWMGMGVAGIIIDSYCGSFPHSLRLAQVSC